MKTGITAWAGFLALSCACAAGAASGNGVHIIGQPEPGRPFVNGTPEAYSPFVLEFGVAGMAVDNNHSIVIDVADKAIVLEYTTDPLRFPEEPPWRHATEVQGLPPGNYSVTVRERYANGDTVLSQEFDFIVAEAPSVQPAYTFFHPDINHYFVTADDHERDLVLADHWYSTDGGFNVWPAEGPAPGAAAPVCRFYSYEVNSHFYTADEPECDYLRENPQTGWLYEGIAFQALTPVAGACPAGTDSVWRLYNNRYAQMDTNHRFVASSETYRTMIADGWVGEGVAFCSPPSAR